MLLIQLSFLPILIRCRAENGLGDGLGEVSLPAGGAISSIPRLAEDFNVLFFHFLILCDDVTWYVVLDGFMLGEQYPESYNSLMEVAYRSGAIKTTGCPDRAPPAL